MRISDWSSDVCSSDLACEVVERDVLVHLMRGGVQQAELGDGAVVLDEARVRGAAGGAELRGAAGDRGDGIGKQRAPRARRTEEGLARNPESEVVAGADRKSTRLNSSH